jgi:hypothetical protein
VQYVCGNGAATSQTAQLGKYTALTPTGANFEPLPCQVIATNPAFPNIGVVSTGDSDGDEGYMWLAPEHFGRHFILPYATQVTHLHCLSETVVTVRKNTPAGWQQVNQCTLTGTSTL